MEASSFLVRTWTIKMSKNNLNVIVVDAIIFFCSEQHVTLNDATKNNLFILRTSQATQYTNTETLHWNTSEEICCEAHIFFPPHIKLKMIQDCSLDTSHAAWSFLLYFLSSWNGIINCERNTFDVYYEELARAQNTRNNFIYAIRFAEKSINSNRTTTHWKLRLRAYLMRFFAVRAVSCSFLLEFGIEFRVKGIWFVIVKNLIRKLINTREK